MNEQSKAILRRLHDHRFISRYFVGDGIDIGCGRDIIGNYAQLFPFMGKVAAWDLCYGHGDAQKMEGVPDNAFDWVTSAHCLEHLHDPYEALVNWVRICKPGGHLILTFPDEDLYEQGVFPSEFNPDHKKSFAICKDSTWSPVSIDVTDLLRSVASKAQVIKVELLDHANFYDVKRFDQTLTPVSESAIEVILRKWTPQDRKDKGHFPRVPE